MSETEKQRNSPSVTNTSSSVLETYNTVVVTKSGFPTVLSSSRNHAMPVIHNVSLLNLPDVEEVSSQDGETILLWSPWKQRNKYRCGQRTVRLAVVKSVVESSSN
ncbi:phosphatase and actin regulator 2 [Trichonephila clavipes]|nr:phosphatase and actin regulator 2 [Trichonephila clavipes]